MQLEIVEAVDRVLRSKSDAYFPHDVGKRVTLVACEKNLAAGYSEKQVKIIVGKCISPNDRFLHVNLINDQYTVNMSSERIVWWHVKKTLQPDIQKNGSL